MYLSFWEYLKKIKILWTPVDMHTSIMCINILQNIKAVGGDSQTNHVSISRRMNKMFKSNYICTCHFENIWWKSKSCGHAHIHYVYKHPATYYSCSSKTVRGVSRTNHVPFMQLVRKKWLSPTTCLFENIWRKSKSCGHVQLCV